LTIENLLPLRLQKIDEIFIDLINNWKYRDFSPSPYHAVSMSKWTAEKCIFFVFIRNIKMEFFVLIHNINMKFFLFLYVILKDMYFQVLMLES